MRNNLKNHIRWTIRRALYGTLGIPMLALPVALAQQATNQPVKMEKTVVTGSLIPTAETVGAAPVDVVETEQIQKLGTQDALNTLKRYSPGFLGSGNVGHTLDNGGYGEAYVALRNLPTLVLLDGRRLAGSAFSALYNAGSQVDLNLIPVSMIERIDVLKDGSSSLYGSDAIGGVINVITKKNWNGAEISGRYGFVENGGYTEQRASIVLGVSNEKTSFSGGAQYFRSDPLLAKERSVGSQGILSLYAQNVAPPTYVSPSYPGRVGNYILASSTLAAGAPGYNPTGPKTPPVDIGTSYATIDAYVAAHPGVYIPLDTLPGASAIVAAGASAASRLNTTDFGTFSIQAQDRRNVLANVDHKVFDERLQLDGSFFYANTTSFGNLAPSPMFGLTIQNILVPGNNPYNPFQHDLGKGADGSINVRTRFVDSGNRNFVSQTDYYRFVGGIKGEFENGYSYESSYYYNRSEQVQFTRNSVNGAGLNQALQPLLNAGTPVLDSQGRPLSLLTDANGVNVPVYNMFSLGGNAPETLRVLKTTLFNSGISDQWAVDAIVRGTPIDLPGGKLGFAVGGTYYWEGLFLETDGLTSLGLVPGLNPASPFPGGQRRQYAGFAEVDFPITSPDLNIIGLHSLDLKVSGRIQHLDPGGDAEVPKASLLWKPIDEQVALRGTYSEGFLAPTLFTLFGPTRVSNPTIAVQGVSAQETVFLPSNATLPPSTSKSWSGGIVYSPKQIPGLTVSADYYYIKQENIPFNPDANSRVASLNALGSASPFASDFRFANGSQLTTTAPNQIFSSGSTNANFGSLVIPTLPGASQRTDGIDLSLIYSHPTENYGKYTGWINANVLLNYEVELGPGQPWYQYAGFFTDPQVAAAYQGTLPDYNVTIGVAWEYRGFTLSANARYIPSVVVQGDMFPTAGGSSSNGFTIDGKPWKVSDWYSIDLQLAYEFGKDKAAKDWYDGTTVRFGINNLTDNIAPLIASSSEDGTDKGTYDILGRFFYFEVAKKF